MMDAPAPQPEPAGAAARDALQRLEEALARQLQDARRGDLQAVADAARRVDGLLEGLRRHQQALAAEELDWLKRIAELHRRVRLIVAQGRQEALQQMQRTSRGRKTLRAYRQQID